MGFYDAVVIGAGPAGLSAAAEITAAGGRCLLVEQGEIHSARDRDSPGDLLRGVGGAGLFSDGKHSFFPAATELWRLPDAEGLAEAYARTRELLAGHGLNAPPLPERTLPRPSEGAGLVWEDKRYPSLYAPLEARMSAIQDLYSQCGEAPWLSAKVIGARRLSAQGATGFELEIEAKARPRRVRTRSLVIATGRLSPLWVKPWLDPLGLSWRFRRLEFGVRVETLSTSGLFTALSGVDPKLTWREPEARLEVRTFCTCRGGEVLLGEISELRAFSGRADGARTGKSSIGIMVRTTDEALARAIGPEVLAARRSPLCLSLSSVLGRRGAHPGLLALFGARGAEMVTYALHRFTERFTELAGDPSARVYAPCIEGVGDYPEGRGDLEPAPGVFVAGDLCGSFRGLVAALVSGRYVGAKIGARR